MSRSGLNITQPSLVPFLLSQHHVEQNLQLLSSLVYFFSPDLGSIIGVANRPASFSPERMPIASAKRRVPLTADSMLSNIDERSCSFSESHIRTRTSGCSIGELGRLLTMAL